MRKKLVVSRKLAVRDTKLIVRKCGACAGTGRNDAGQAGKCPTCQGSGVVTEAVEVRR